MFDDPSTLLEIADLPPAQMRAVLRTAAMAKLSEDGWVEIPRRKAFVMDSLALSASKIREVFDALDRFFERDGNRYRMAGSDGDLDAHTPQKTDQELIQRGGDGSQLDPLSGISSDRLVIPMYVEAETDQKVIPPPGANGSESDPVSDEREGEWIETRSEIEQKTGDGGVLDHSSIQNPQNGSESDPASTVLHTERESSTERVLCDNPGTPDGLTPAPEPPTPPAPAQDDEKMKFSEAQITDWLGQSIRVIKQQISSGEIPRDAIPALMAAEGKAYKPRSSLLDELTAAFTRIPQAEMAPMFTAIKAAFGYGERMTYNERGMTNKAAAELIRAGYEPDDAQVIYDYCRAQGWNGSFKPTALLNHASAAMAAQEGRSTQKTYGPGWDATRDAQLRRYTEDSVAANGGYDYAAMGLPEPEGEMT